ncbi:methyl-accepting chemotaxis protein [Pseudobutyrivibrio xylanivorans]|uniref:Methyl-accepting chemotaxis protein n=1 Tax=Pseudobutyrivibrio xylanivorans TaxID=185007 RepID=A0A5P6VMX7_PSEXY|nr:methyl-accepting chemotaxis protein [Pseudobutyrivibrio xylanivorans]QFJ53708.1 methyl-accepting chemotaxis protein [Pseudobutyrivibrio xylanivorans]
MKKKSIFSSVKAKLIFTMVFLAAIPLIAATTINYVRTTSSAKAEAQITLNWSAWYLEGAINKTFSETELALQTLACSQDTIDFIRFGRSEYEVKKQMEIINNYFDDGNVITLSDATGMMILRSDDGKLSDIHERDYWIGAMSGKTTASAVIVSSSTNARSICIGVPVYDASGNMVIGVLHRSYNLEQFREVLGEDGEEAFLVDHQGTLASHAFYEIKVDDAPVLYTDEPYITSDLENEVYQTTIDGTDKYIAYVREPVTGYIVCDAMDIAAVTKSARLSALTTIVFGLILLLLAGILAYLQAVSFTRPIIEVNKTLAELADGSFVKIDKYTNRNDEFGEIVNNTNSLIDKLSTIVGHIKNSSNTVAASSDELSNMADQIATTTETVATSVQHIASGAVQQSEDIQSAAEGSGKITDAVGSVQASTVEMAELAKRMKAASEASTSSLDILQNTSSDMTTKIEEISSRISSTQNAVSNINDRVEGISGIASQTNLLSLNASIEAARAGEMGKGFAVVAEEIRKLADDSDSLASEIRSEMDALLQEAEQAVNAATHVMEGNAEQQKALAKTFESVKGMLEDIEETVRSVDKISNEADTCVDSNALVSSAMTSLSAISEENAASSETTGASVQELSATVSTLADSAASLKDIAEQLNEEMKFFK